MATITHGSNRDCPKVRSGEWPFCKGHESSSRQPEAVRRALELATLLAPEHMDGFARLVRNAQKDGGDEVSVVKELISAIHDGLAFGNWPE